MNNSSNPTIIEDCLRFSMADLKRLGFFKPNSVVSDMLNWSNSNSSIRIRVDCIRKLMSLEYVVDGERNMKYSVSIIERKANLGKGAVKYFRCPVCHLLCRNLYLYHGVFVSRRAMRGAMYRNQTRSKRDRMMPDGWASEDFIPIKRYGKTHYRGKITPYGKRVKRYQNIVYRCGLRATCWLFHKLRCDR